MSCSSTDICCIGKGRRVSFRYLPPILLLQKRGFEHALALGGCSVINKTFSSLQITAYRRECRTHTSCIARDRHNGVRHDRACGTTRVTLLARQRRVQVRPLYGRRADGYSLINMNKRRARGITSRSSQRARESLHQLPAPLKAGRDPPGNHHSPWCARVCCPRGRSWLLRARRWPRRPQLPRAARSR